MTFAPHIGQKGLFQFTTAEQRLHFFILRPSFRNKDDY